MTTSIADSAYPPQIEALMPQARKLAERLGDIPSRNALMKEFRIGAPKANAVREALADDADTVAALDHLADQRANRRTDGV